MFSCATLSGPLETDAVASDGSPCSHTRAVGLASRLCIHCESARTVLTNNRLPNRIATNGTRLGLPEMRPVVSTITMPVPMGSGVVTPDSTIGRITEFSERKRTDDVCTGALTPYQVRTFRLRHFGPLVLQ